MYIKLKHFDAIYGNVINMLSTFFLILDYSWDKPYFCKESLPYTGKVKNKSIFL